jgi:hypothetical protein
MEKYKNKQKVYTKEMKDYFYKRTYYHTELVKKYMLSIYDLKYFTSDRNNLFLKNALEHDASKFIEPEKIPYIILTWQKFCQDNGKEFEINSQLKNKMVAATNYHIKNNLHHPEFWDPKKSEYVNMINSQNKDGVPNRIIDATSMPKLYLAEMIADWCAMSEERKNSPIEWAKKTINKRWKFTSEQEEFIYTLISKIWDKNEK